MSPVKGARRKRFAGSKEAALPSLIRLLVVILVLAGGIYGGAYWLANKVQPISRDVTFTVPNDRYSK